MKKFSVFLMFAFLAVVQPQSQRGGSIIKLDPALDSIVSANARVEVLKDDYFGIAEGPDDDFLGHPCINTSCSWIARSTATAGNCFIG